jgi:ribosomal protein S27AE
VPNQGSDVKPSNGCPECGDKSALNQFTNRLWSCAACGWEEEPSPLPSWVTYDVAPEPALIPRQKITAVLLRAAERATEIPAVLSIHVFGSYSRGAPLSHDLDVIVNIGRVSDPRGEAAANTIWFRRRSAESIVARKLFGNTVPVDLLVNASTDHPEWAPKLVWSRKEPDAPTNLSKIVLDPAAGRFQRDHFIAVKRTASGLSAMDEVMEAIRRGALTLEVIPFPAHVRWLKKDQPRYRPGKKVLNLLPAAYWWLRQQGAGERWSYLRGTELSTLDWRKTHVLPEYMVKMGNIDLYEMQNWLNGFKDGRCCDPFDPEGYRFDKVCLIPHLAKGERPEMYVFSRGANYASHSQTRSP